MMEIVKMPSEMTAWSRKERSLGHSIGFVPTMGFFHEGHLALMRLAGQRADKVVASLFVNPTQFGPHEDLSNYPSDVARDCQLAEESGVAVLFVPDAETMYPEGACTTVAVNGLTRNLCGVDRPGHFDGVTTIVTKLFNIVQPDLAVFGRKDFQQLVVIRQMCRDLNIGVKIVGHPIVREADGLAMSSRNSYLTDSLREAALSLSRAIQLARKQTASGERDPGIMAASVRTLIDSYPDTAIDYIQFVDQHDLKAVKTITCDTVLALAVKIGGKVRLIDNGFLLDKDS